jgi:hypothetical protein
MSRRLSKVRWDEQLHVEPGAHGASHLLARPYLAVNLSFPAVIPLLLIRRSTKFRTALALLRRRIYLMQLRMRQILNGPWAFNEQTEERLRHLLALLAPVANFVDSRKACAISSRDPSGAATHFTAATSTDVTSAFYRGALLKLPHRSDRFTPRTYTDWGVAELCCTPLKTAHDQKPTKSSSTPRRSKSGQGPVGVLRPARWRRRPHLRRSRVGTG